MCPQPRLRARAHAHASTFTVARTDAGCAQTHASCAGNARTQEHSELQKQSLDHVINPLPRVLGRRFDHCLELVVIIGNAEQHARLQRRDLDGDGAAVGVAVSGHALAGQVHSREGPEQSIHPHFASEERSVASPHAYQTIRIDPGTFLPDDGAIETARGEVGALGLGPTRRGRGEPARCAGRGEIKGHLQAPRALQRQRLARAGGSKGRWQHDLLGSGGAQQRLDIGGLQSQLDRPSYSQDAGPLHAIAAGSRIAWRRHEPHGHGVCSQQACGRRRGRPQVLEVRTGASCEAAGRGQDDARLSVGVPELWRGIGQYQAARLDQLLRKERRRACMCPRGTFHVSPFSEAAATSQKLCDAA
mmetsp:Transcript_28805/g.79380  ORF Transcript_28805/g.79380 Transcript_28805/m.79380 type:complete len:360 (-) Transcript_28805:274-1353(-)